MMSDSGAGLLSWQLGMYRFMDTLNKTRDTNQLAADHAVLRQRFADLVHSYERLDADRNQLLRRATGLAKDYDQQTATIARLQQANADARAECEKLREALRVCKLDLALARQIVRQDHPDLYLPDDY